MNKWQPIETAPKDGSEFLGFDKIWGKRYVCVWATRGRKADRGVKVRDIGSLHQEYPYESKFERELVNLAIRYWMPLPDPPTPLTITDINDMQIPSSRFAVEQTS